MFYGYPASKMSGYTNKIPAGTFGVQPFGKGKFPFWGI